MKSDKDFLQRMTILAQLCNFTLSPFLVDLYIRHLGSFGFDTLCLACEDFIAKRKSRDPFPSVQDFHDKINPPISAEIEAIESAARIIQSISRYGWCNAALARKHIGELGWRVVERFGGWTKVCETVTPDNVPTLQAQFRNLANATQKRASQGLDESAPQINPSETNRDKGLVRASEIASKLLE